jgi:HIRAN domain
MPDLACNLAGVTHANADGVARQQLLTRCNIGQLLLLEAEPDNPVDPFAVRVVATGIGQIGYLPMAVAQELATRGAVLPRGGALVEINQPTTRKPYIHARLLFNLEDSP